MKKSFKKEIFFALSALFLPIVSSAETYQFLVKGIPYINDVNESAGLAGYLDAFFKFGLGIAVFLAVGLFVYYGVVYMTSDATGQKETAKGAFKNIIFGLVLAFSIVLILREINPALVKFELFRTLQEVKEGVKPRDVTPSPEEQAAIQEELDERERLKRYGIVVSQEPCLEGQVAPDCVNVVGLGGAASHLIGLATELGGCGEELWPEGCPIRITGGTEDNHSTHGPFKPVVDIRKHGSVNSYVQINYTQCNGIYKDLRGRELGRVWIKPNSQIYYLDETGGDWGAHWHICLGASNCTGLAAQCASVAN